MRTFSSVILALVRASWITLFLLFIGPGAVQVVSAQEPGECRIDRGDSITLHIEGSAGDRVYVVCVDLTDPHIRLETVLANDTNSVNPSPDQRERLHSMAEREPYSLHHPIVAINADYFGVGHGPEGLTVKNGFRIDGPHSNDYDYNETKRTSLSVSRSNAIELGHKRADEVVNSLIHRTRFFNSAGGGPNLVRDGQVIQNPCEASGENVTLYNCSDRGQTAIGVSQDGQTLIIVVAESKSGQQMGEILQKYGAHMGIKFDGGGSSQLWYRGDYRADGDERSIADAVLVLREEIRRHDASLIYQSEYPILEPGEEADLIFRLRNMGFLTWEPDLPYALMHTGGESFGLATWQSLSPSWPDVLTGRDLSWKLPIIAPQNPGVYQTRWQMAYQSSTGEEPERFGPEIVYVVTVVPEGRPPNLIDAIRQIIDQLKREAQRRIEEFLDELKRRIEELIREEIERRLQLECCQGTLGMTILVSGAAIWGRRKRKS